MTKECGILKRYEYDDIQRIYIAIRGYISSVK